MKRLGAVLLGCLLALSGCVFPLTGEAKTGGGIRVSAPETKQYLILGDSIAAHHGISEKNSYAHLLGERLESEDEKWQGENWGVSGYTTTDLITLLEKNKEKPERRKVLEDADLICISIGGNDLLGFIRERGYANFPEGSVGEWAQLIRDFQAGAADFRVNLLSGVEGIVRSIRSVNDHAVILIQNLFNVARDVRGTITLLGQEITLTDVAEPCFIPIREVLAENADRLGYYVADTYSAFLESQEPSLLRREMIHPNARGHALIADVLASTYRAHTEG